jgi:hypothetical protein
MPWRAKPGCAEHHRAAVERIVNLLPPAWLLEPQSGEIFNSLEHCDRRLRGYSLAEGFDIVRKGGGSKSNPSWRFFCIHHGSKTQNTRKLEDEVERDDKGSINSRRQRENTNVGQLDCKWEGLCSFKDLGKRGSGNKGYILTMKCVFHNHELADDPFQFSAHLKSSKEYVEDLCQSKKHREQVLPYSDSRRLIDAEDLGVIVSARDYYNTVRKERPDKLKPKTIVALLRTLKDSEFVYRTRC